MKSIPGDFSLWYEWDAGSLPPPYHYEYKILIGPGAVGKFIYHAGYDAQPVWEEALAITPEQIVQLYNVLQARRGLRKRWHKRKEPLLGGSHAWMEVTAQGKQWQIPDDLEPTERQSIQPLYEAILALVPQQAWDRMEARRQEYADKNTKSGA